MSTTFGATNRILSGQRRKGQFNIYSFRAVVMVEAAIDAVVVAAVAVVTGVITVDGLIADFAKLFRAILSLLQ